MVTNFPVHRVLSPFPPSYGEALTPTPRQAPSFGLCATATALSQCLVGFLISISFFLALTATWAASPEEMLEKDYPNLFSLYGKDAAKLPAHYVIAIDVSGSMKPFSEIMVSSIQDFIASLPDGDYVSLVKFGTAVEKIGVPAYLTPENRTTVSEFIRGVAFDENKTNLRGGIGLILDELNKPAAERIKFLFIFTDFDDEPPANSNPPSWESLASRFASEQSGGGVEVYALKLPLDGATGKDLPSLKKVFPGLQEVPVDRGTLQGWFDRRKAEILRDRLRFVINQDLDRPLAEYSVKARGGSIWIEFQPAGARIPVSGLVQEVRFPKPIDWIAPEALPIALDTGTAKATVARTGEGPLVQEQISLDAVDLSGATLLGHSKELEKLGIPASRPWSQTFELNANLAVGKFSASFVVLAAVVGGLVLLIIVLILLKSAASLMPKPVFGSIEWRMGASNGRQELTGRSFDLSSLAIPGWSPGKNYTLRNIREEMHLCPAKETPRSLRNGGSFTLDGATFIFRSQV
jgi:hypothetical protein